MGKICQLEESEDADVKKYFKGETNTKNENSTKKETSPKKEANVIKETSVKKQTSVEKEINVKKETDVKMKPTRLGPRSRLTSSNNAIVSFLKNAQCCEFSRNRPVGLYYRIVGSNPG